MDAEVDNVHDEDTCIESNQADAAAAKMELHAEETRTEWA